MSATNTPLRSAATQHPTWLGVCVEVLGTRDTEIAAQKVHDIYFNDSGISHSFDYFETGCGEGPGTWGSLAVHTLRNLKKQVERVEGRPTLVQRGSAMELPLPDGCLDAVVTRPAL